MGPAPTDHPPGTGGTTLAHYRGCFLGGAAGDALGAAVEFLRLDEIRGAFGPDGIRAPAHVYGRAGAITDDTQMLLFTAEGLLRAHHARAAGRADPVEAHVWRAYQRWLRTQDRSPPAPAVAGGDGWLVGHRELFSSRAPGNTCLAALRSGVMGTPDRPVNDSKGCGTVMRIAPAGLLGAGGGARAFDLGVRLAALTHGNPTGQAAAGFFAQLVREMADGRDFAPAVRAALAVTEAESGSRETVRAVRAAMDLARSSQGKPEDVELLGGGWVAEEAAAIAVYCTLRARDFAHGVRMAVNHSGDSDSTGSMAGSLLGLLHGEAAIPREWLDVLELRDVIGELAEDFWRHFGAEPPAACGGSPGCGQLGKYPGE